MMGGKKEKMKRDEKREKEKRSNDGITDLEKKMIGWEKREK